MAAAPDELRSFPGLTEFFLPEFLTPIGVRKGLCRAREMSGSPHHFEAASHGRRGAAGGDVASVAYCVLLIGRDVAMPPGKTATCCPCGWLYPGPEGKEPGLGKGRVGGLS